MDGPSLGRRIRAAQALGGFESIEQLATAISSPGLSAKTLRRIVNDNDARQARPHELREIARACDVPYEFFTADSPVQSPEDQLNQRLGRIEEAVEYLTHWQEGEVLQRILEYRTEAYGRVFERLEQIDRRLERIEPSLTEDLTQLRRRWAQTLGQPASADQATPVADEPRDGGDAKKEAAASRARGKRAGGERPER